MMIRRWMDDSANKKRRGREYKDKRKGGGSDRRGGRQDKENSGKT